MTSAPGIAVVLFESRPLLEPLLRSLRAQSRELGPWVFCVNGPDDGAAAFLRAQPEVIHLVERPENPGFSGGANAALELLRELGDPEFVLLLNPDVELDSDWLAQGLATLQLQTRAAALGGLLWREGRDGETVVDSAGFAVQPWLRIVDRDAGQNLQTWSRRAGPVLGVCGAAMLLRMAAVREVAEQGQVFDEDFWMYKEDQELGLRLRNGGHEVFFEPAARARHQRGWSPGSRRDISQKLRQHSLKNRYLLLAKHFGIGQVWRIPLILAFELFLGLKLLVSEPGTLRAYLMAGRLWKRAWKKGRALRKRRLGNAW